MVEPFLNNDGTPNRYMAMVGAALVQTVYANDRAAAEQLAQTAFGGNVTYFVSRPEEDLPSYCVIVSGDDCICVIAGCENTHTIIQYYLGSLVSRYIGQETVTNSFAERIYQQSVVEALQQIPQDNPNLRLHFIGHSFGADLAIHAGIKSATELGADKVQVLTFASPKGFSSDFHLTLPNTVCQIVDPLDPVPYVPGSFILLVQGEGIENYNGSFISRFRHVTPLQSIQNDGTYITRPATDLDNRDIANVFDVSPTPHMMTSYLRKVHAGWNSAGPADSQLVVGSICSAIANSESLPEIPPTLPPKSYVDYDATNQILYQTSASQIISPNNYSSGTYITATVVRDSAGITTNIGELQRGVLMADATQYNIQLIYGNGQHSRSEKHTLSTTGSTTTVITQAKELAYKRSWLFGNIASARANNSLGIASPAVQYIRISSALNPRQSFLLDLTNSKDYFGAAHANNKGADGFANSLVMSIKGLNSVDGTTKRSKAIIFQGHPDHAIVDGLYTPSASVSSGETFDGKWLDYLNYLTLTPVQWGFMGTSATEEKKVVTACTVVSQVYQLTVPGHGYDSGDKIRLTSCDVKGFNGSYTIQKVSSDVISLVKGPNSNGPAPTFGKVQRYQLASGVRKQQFYRYQIQVPTNADNHGLRVSGKKLANVFSPFHRSRRQHKR